MDFPGWSISLVLLALQMTGYGSDEVICSQALSDCTMKDELSLTVEEHPGVDVRSLTPCLELYCEDGEPCVLRLEIDAEINVHLDKDTKEEDHSGLDEEDYSEETSHPEASVTLCYNAAQTVPLCKKVEFTVNHTALTQQGQTKLSIMIIKPAGISFSSHVTVYPSKASHLRRDVLAPSLDEVCSQGLQERVEECQVPRLSSVINQERNQLELQSAGSNKRLPSVCIQYEHNGICQRWSRTTIPLYSVTTCMCFQAWFEDQWSRHSQSCPFTNIEFFQSNVWQNVSVSVGQGQMRSHRSTLRWNLTAPCRLEGEVWPCRKESSCREIKGFRQQLTNGTWRQNSKGHWEKIGVFEDIDLQLSPCVKVKIKGMRSELGPFCFNNTDRWRWSLLVVGVMLLVCISAILFYLLHDFVKKWVWSCCHGGFVEIGRKRHVLLLSPPHVDDAVTESVSQLGSLLCNQGFGVSVDLWSRKEQCTMGPLPWFHAQLLEMHSQGGRVVLVLTHKALKRAEEWTQEMKASTKEEDEGLPQMSSPYSDIFLASLRLIQADKQQSRAGKRFLLVKFDSKARSDRTLPEPLRGLRLFHLPSQTQDLLKELTVAGAGRGSSRRTWTGWKWNIPDGWRAKTKEEPDLQKTPGCKYVGVKPLRQL